MFRVQLFEQLEVPHFDNMVDHWLELRDWNQHITHEVFQEVTPL